MKQLQLLSVLLLLFSSKLFALDYKNETMKTPARCLFQCVLEDGFYIGVAAGYDSYQMNTRVSTSSAFFDDAVAFSADPVLNADGIVGGVYFGYGRDFPGFYRTYLGIEAFGYGSAAASGLQITANDSIDEIDVMGKNNIGIEIIPGIKLVPGTLLYVKLGVLASKINVSETFLTDGAAMHENDENPMLYGWNAGIGIENAFFDDFSIRAEYNYQWYGDFKTDVGTKITPSNGEFLLGLSYRIVL